jgi:hypothetical protein
MTGFKSFLSSTAEMDTSVHLFGTVIFFAHNMYFFGHCMSLFWTLHANCDFIFEHFMHFIGIARVFGRALLCTLLPKPQASLNPRMLPTTPKCCPDSLKQADGRFFVFFLIFETTANARVFYVQCPCFSRVKT